MTFDRLSSNDRIVDKLIKLLITCKYKENKQNLLALYFLFTKSESFMRMMVSYEGPLITA